MPCDLTTQHTYIALCRPIASPSRLFPAVAAVSFLWTVIISLMRGTLDKKHKGEPIPALAMVVEPTVALASDK